MLTLKQINDDKEAIIAGLEKKHFSGAREAIDEVLRIDAERKAAQQQKDAASAEVLSWRRVSVTRLNKPRRKQAC